MSEDFEREERAFADALRKDAPVEAFRPLDPEALKAAAGPVAGARRSRWLKGLAAAAAVVVVAGAGAVILPGMFGGSAASTVAGAPEAYPASGAASVDGQDRASTDADPGPATVPPAPAGFRWESYRDVQVQVPDTWAYASAPQSDYCIRKDLPLEPYVDLNRGVGPAAAILCGGDLSDDRQAMHLSFTPVAGPLPFAAPSTQWRQYRRELGQARITVTARADDAGLANRILATASLVPAGTDPNGCPVNQPAVPPVALAGLDAGELGVCLYEANDDRGAFRSSVLLTGAAAQRAWQAVLAAPEGGGPDGSASSCGTSPGWPMLLLVGAERVPVAASVAGCVGNGVADAAAADQARALTSELCRALFVDPVRISAGFGPAAAACVR